jgi:hypothetical protein
MAVMVENRRAPMDKEQLRARAAGLAAEFDDKRRLRDADCPALDACMRLGTAQPHCVQNGLRVMFNEDCMASVILLLSQPK